MAVALSAIGVPLRVLGGTFCLDEGLRDTGTTILLTGHQLAEAERLCSRVALMQGGRVAASGTVHELLARVPGQSVATVQSQDSEATLHRAQSLELVGDGAALG